MNRLPNEILELIFYKLSLDGLSACKLVNKQWCSIINCMKKKDLILTDFELPLNCRWFQTKKRINYLNLIECSSRHLIQSVLNNLNFNKLKQLYIFKKSLSIRSFDDTFNQFAQLEMLEIVHSEIELDNSHSNGHRLNLPKLRHLNLEASVFSQRIALNLPQLTKLSIKYVYVDRFEFECPSSVKILELKLSDNLENDEYFVRSFLNLQAFYCNRIDCLSSDFLFNLHFLKQLHFQGPIETFNCLRQQKLRFRRFELQIYYFGVNLSNSHEFNGNALNYGNQLNVNTIKLYNQNYARLANVIPFIKLINYNELEDNFENALVPNDFIERFVNLDHLSVNKRIKNVGQFNYLLANCISLNSLRICSSSLKQEFFNNLPNQFQVMKDLIIKNETTELDFKFMLCFECLEFVEIDQQMRVELVIEMIKKYKKLKQFSFVCKEEIITIVKYDNGYLMVYTNTGLNRFKCFDELFNFLVSAFH